MEFSDLPARGRHPLRSRCAILGVALLCAFGVRPAAALDPHAPFHAFVVDDWGVEQGLPQISVLSIAEDSAGYLWVATQIGVARFDGEHFTTFDRNAAGVDTSMLAAAWADAHGQVWFGGARGLLREREAHFSDLGGSAVYAIVDGDDGSPLLGTERGLARVRGDRIESVPGYSGAAYSLLRDGRSLWIGGSGRVCRLDDGAAHAACFPLRGTNGEPLIVAHLARAQGALWLGTHEGLKRLDGGRIAASGLNAEIDHTSIEALHTDRDGTLWIGTVPALFRRVPGGSIERIADPDIAHDPWTQTLYEDRVGNLWLGSHTEGLYRVLNGWTRRVSGRDGLADAFVWSIVHAPDGNLIFGTNSDIETFDGARAHPFIAGSALPNATGYELYFDSRGRLWIGTRAGIAVYDHGRIDTPAALSALSNLQVNEVREIADDDYWIGTSGGLYRWRNGVLARADSGASVAAARIRTLLPLGDRLLFGTEDGVREWRDGRITQPAWAAPLRGHFVSRLARLRAGVLGVATIDAGVGAVVGDRLRMTSQKDGLPSDNAWTLDVVGGDLYVASIAGVWRLPLAQLPLPGSPMRTIAPQLIVGENRVTSLHNQRCCNGGAGARSLIDGHQIWYSTVAGALRVDARALGAPPQPPAAMIESIIHDGDSLPPRPLDLRKGARDLEIQYTAPYLGIGKLRFRYMLEGYDAGWQQAQDRRTAFYTHLPPGDYRFRVAAAIEGNPQFGRTATLAIDVEPHWYERLLVRTAAALLLCAGLALAVWWGFRAQRRRNAWLEAQVARRTTQLARANERLRMLNLALAEESHTDALTLLHNRRHLLARLPDVIASAQKIGVLLIDLDHFKQINDRYGHAVGDAVLLAFGRLLTAGRRERDIVVRWGGEEFLLLLPGVDADGALAIAERLRRDIAARGFSDGRGGAIHLTCSIGFSLHPLAMDADGAVFEAALELADLALYRAKHDGRDTCVGLVANAPLPAEILQDPLAPQLDELLARGRLRWVSTRT